MLPLSNCIYLRTHINRQTSRMPLLHDFFQLTTRYASFITIMIDYRTYSNRDFFTGPDRLDSVFEDNPKLCHLEVDGICRHRKECSPNRISICALKLDRIDPIWHRKQRYQIEACTHAVKFRHIDASEPK